MQLLLDFCAVILGYLLGSIPVGFLIVRLKTGQDIRTVESGRTGGTNVVRAAGFWAGFLTALLDILKGVVSVWLARAMSQHQIVHVLAPIATILGHNYSLFIAERDENGKMKFRGGAGGATALGGAVGLWYPIFPIIITIGALIWFTLGIASVTTMAVGLVVIVVFAIRSSLGLQSSTYIWFGVIAELLLIWALRPNIQKLISGNERVIKYSLNGWLRARKSNPETGGTSDDSK